MNTMERAQEVRSRHTQEAEVMEIVVTVLSMEGQDCHGVLPLTEMVKTKVQEEQMVIAEVEEALDLEVIMAPAVKMKIEWDQGLEMAKLETREGGHLLDELEKLNLTSKRVLMTMETSLVFHSREVTAIPYLVVATLLTALRRNMAEPRTMRPAVETLS